MSDLYSLYKLHKIDEMMHSLRQQAAALDTGQEEEKALAALKSEHSEVLDLAKKLTSELHDREIQQKGFEDKLASLNTTLFDGSLVSPKEVNNIEREIQMVKAQRDSNDERILELYEEEPPAAEEAVKASAHFVDLEESLSIKKRDAIQRHAEMKTEFDAFRKERPDYLTQVDSDLLEMYDEIKEHTGDVAMAVVTDGRACDRCGVSIPEKTMERLKADRVVTCEDCRRILFRMVSED